MRQKNALQCLFLFQSLPMKFTISIFIQKPTETVFRLLSSPLRLPEWTHGLESVRSVKGRRSQVGGESKLFFKEQKTSFSIQEKVLTFDRGECFETLLDHQEILTTIRYTLKAEGNGTILTASYAIKFKNMLNGFFSIFFKKPMKKQQTADLTAFKKMVERER